MPLPNVYPFTTDRVIASAPSVANGTVSIAAPTAGRVIKVGVTPGTAVTTGATVTTDIAGTAIPGGVLTVPTGGATVTVSAQVSAPCNEDDPIDFVFSGGGAGGAQCTVFAVVRSGF